MRSFVTVILALSAFMLASAASPPKKLVIEKTYVPESCPVTTKTGDTLRMSYVGKFFHDGREFERADKTSPSEFKLGSHSVVEGWNQGLKDMCIGEKRKLVIPPDLAYGEKGIRYRIPRMATLIFEVELLAVNGKYAGEEEYHSDEL